MRFCFNEQSKSDDLILKGLKVIASLKKRTFA